MYRPSESIIEHRLARTFPAKRLYELARRTELVERRRKLDAAALFWGLTLGFAMSDELKIALAESFEKAILADSEPKCERPEQRSGVKFASTLDKPCIAR